MPDKLAITLKAKHERLDLTQARLAELCGVSRKTINSVFIPSTPLALKLSHALDRPIEALFQLVPNT